MNFVDFVDIERYFDTADIRGNYQQAIAEGVAEALKTFCGQSREFKQAVEQSDKSFKDCLDSIATSIKGKKSVSDFKVYQTAADFYFQGAKIHFDMRIDLGEDIEEPQEQAKNSICISLDDLLDF